MKAILALLSLMFAAGACSQLTAAGDPSVVVGFNSYVIVHATIVSVPKATAAELLDNPLIKTDPERVLGLLHKLVVAGNATYIANPSLKVMDMNKASTKSLTELTIEATIGPDNYTLDVYLSLRYSAGQFNTRLTTRRGATCFLGSADPKPAANAAAQPQSTHLIFLRVE